MVLVIPTPIKGPIAVNQMLCINTNVYVEYVGGNFLENFISTVKSGTAAFNFGDMSLRNAKSLGENPLWFFAIFYSKYLAFIKSPIPVRSTIIVALLRCSVSIILGFSSYFEMFWVNTRWIITDVHNYLTYWYLTLKKFIGKSMGPGRNFPGHQENAISIFVDGSLPQPAGLSFFNSVKENIVRAKDRIILKIAGPINSPITAVTKLSSYTFCFAAQNTRNNPSNFVCHLLAPLMASGIFYIHGEC